MGARLAEKGWAGTLVKAPGPVVHNALLGAPPDCVKHGSHWRLAAFTRKSCLGNVRAPTLSRQRASFHNVLGNHDRGPKCPPLFCALPCTGATFRGPASATRSVRTSDPCSGSWHLNARSRCGEPSQKCGNRRSGNWAGRKRSGSHREVAVSCHSPSSGKRVMPVTHETEDMTLALDCALTK